MFFIFYSFGHSNLTCCSTDATKLDFSRKTNIIQFQENRKSSFVYLYYNFLCINFCFLVTYNQLINDVRTWKARFRSVIFNDLLLPICEVLCSCPSEINRYYDLNSIKSMFWFFYFSHFFKNMTSSMRIE